MLRPRLAHAACAFLLFTSAAFGAGTFTVTNVNDAGAGSLRKALLDANAAGGGTVVFAIGSGPQTIQPQSPYPEMNYIVVDGTTQPGYAGKPLIEVDGSLAVTDIVGGLFNVNAGSIRGLVINNSTGGGVKISAGDVRACYIGTNIDGTAAKPNKAGVRINGPNVIVEDNLISGNPIGVIVNFWGPALIDGNRFGTDANETKALSTTAIHVYVTDNFDPIIVGGGWPNTFAGGSVGVYASYAKKVAVDQNYFGVTASGRRLPIQTAVHIYQSSDCSVTGSHIKGNSYGILIDGSSLRNKILGNSIDDNDVGIELSDYPYDGPTPNDDGDGDTGPNNYVNYPVLTRVTSLGGTTTVTGSLNSAANRTYRVELFASPSCAASGFGQGRQLVKALNVTTGPDGNATIAQTFAGTLNAGDVMTATATSDLEGTSEFSRCRIIEGNGVFSFEHATQSVSESSAIELTVRRNRGAAGPATVHFATSDGTAKAGSDYTSASGILSFADGETSKTIPITLNNDALWEGSQTFQITLSEATGAVLGTPQTVTVTIDDDENAPVAAVQTTSVFEGN
ncbi:MAG TPA: Calx-beta domain-containing protein, partial [Thermoanaerobaculia bacterium]|nr:Calx-beta domain-containing protein [Thermoanaerobaculia bacterium]